MGSNTWHEVVPNHDEFKSEMLTKKQGLSADIGIRQESLNLYLSSAKYSFGYHSEWLGVPIIRLAEDIVREQEIIFREKPDLIIEVGIARGGGLVFSASMQQISGLNPKVIGIDNKIYPHTRHAIDRSRFSNFITMYEGDSTSKDVISWVSGQVKTSTKVLLVLDSDHSMNHVYEELVSYVPLLPIGSIVLVCDTVIDELPPGTYPERTWADGNGPLAGLEQFLIRFSGVQKIPEDSSDLLMSEIRGGVLKVTNLVEAKI